MKIVDCKDRKYKGVGFVEALIAIVVAGIASIVLMGIAVNTTNRILLNEVENRLTEKAIEGGTMVRSIANSHNVSEDALFPSVIENLGGNCFALGGDAINPSFVSSGGSFPVACRYDSGDRSGCLTHSSQDPEIFRVFCFLPTSIPDEGLVVGKVITGLSDCDGSTDKGKCRTSDYEYFLGIKVRE